MIHDDYGFVKCIEPWKQTERRPFYFWKEIVVWVHLMVLRRVLS